MAQAHGERPSTADDSERGHKPLEGYDRTPVRFFRFRIIAMGVIVSMGGLIFGYDTGQISGFISMKDFIGRFGDNGGFSNWKEGLIVGLVCSCTRKGFFR
jgi:MFS transporter, SP family, sugar:H+ symporter